MYILKDGYEQNVTQLKVSDHFLCNGIVHCKNIWASGGGIYDNRLRLLTKREPREATFGYNLNGKFDDVEVGLDAFKFFVFLFYFFLPLAKVIASFAV